MMHPTHAAQRSYAKKMFWLCAGESFTRCFQLLGAWQVSRSSSPRRWRFCGEDVVFQCANSAPIICNVRWEAAPGLAAFLGTGGTPEVMNNFEIKALQFLLANLMGTLQILCQVYAASPLLIPVGFPTAMLC